MNTPSHDLKSHSTITIESLDYVNPYDFTAVHRHNYFELICFEKGGGIQLVDFNEYPIKDYSAYLIHPNQIHLLTREVRSKGFLFQFYPEQIISSEISSYTAFYDLENPAFFEGDEHLFSMLNSYKRLFELESRKSKKSDFYLLNSMLLDLIRPAQVNFKSDSGKTTYRFKELLESEYKGFHKVSQYADALNVSSKNLHALTNKHFGISPLKMIHNRLFLEAKRLLLFQSLSIKEIGYELGFLDASSFSNFIKSKSGSSPLALQREIRKIHE
ncbi:MAG: helix-turn-helix transcriptional regulator [Flavobacteriales bacterium]|jgi:AraC family transcriptional activator of pobA